MFVVVTLAFVISVEAALKDICAVLQICSLSAAGVGSSGTRLQHGGH